MIFTEKTKCLFAHTSEIVYLRFQKMNLPYETSYIYFPHAKIIYAGRRPHPATTPYSCAICA